MGDPGLGAGPLAGGAPAAGAGLTGGGRSEARLEMYEQEIKVGRVAGVERDDWFSRLRVRIEGSETSVEIWGFRWGRWQTPGGRCRWVSPFRSVPVVMLKGAPE